MSNPSTVAGFVGAGTIRNTFPLQTIAATGPTALTIGTDSGTSIFFLTVPSATAAIGASNIIGENDNSSITSRSGREYGLPSGQAAGFTTNSIAPGHPFKVRISGTGTAGANAAQSVIVNLYQGTSATLGSDTVIASTGAALLTVAGGAFHFFIEATLFWDSTSQIVSGYYTSNIAFGTASQIVTPTLIGPTGSPASVTGVTASGLSFLAGVALGNAASSSVQLTEFVVDEI